MSPKCRFFSVDVGQDCLPMGVVFWPTEEEVEPTVVAMLEFSPVLANFTAFSFSVSGDKSASRRRECVFCWPKTGEVPVGLTAFSVVCRRFGDDFESIVFQQWYDAYCGCNDVHRLVAHTDTVAP